ncbi:MAG: D-tyrosyl-tRNA(Tyr) deacylase [Bacteroidetes bacterium]|jgi:D-tyrosyl-tRNA(Tyr) deacylase|nr:D-tyrosyl-tRNA(Tyr) deacylase [Bacteroidota bacterium]
MKIVLQRCSRAEVRINGETVGRIGTGFVVLVGITHNDTREDAEFLAKKVAGMRVFEDTEGKMNLSLAEVGGQILSISQFTLYGNARKGNRPSFIEAARPEVAEPLYEYFNQVLREQYGLHVETGRFGANMQVDFVNDGPVTIIVDSCQGSVIGINN